MNYSPFGSLPARGGIGLKPEHYAAVLEAAGRGIAPAFVEVHPQNYFGAGGPPHRWLGAIAETLPLSFHSVGLSLGDPGGCDREELAALAALCARYQPAMVSDHLSWSSLNGERIPDLLPIPMTRATLDHFGSEISRVQDRLKRAILIENPSRTLAFRDDRYAEPEFLDELCAATGCGILLDVNNVLVSATNLGLSPEAYVDSIDPRRVGEIHVAGHKVEIDEDGARTAIDDHGSPVSDACWALLERFIARAGAKPVLVERDTDIPPFAELAAEAAIADSILAQGWAHAA